MFSPSEKVRAPGAWSAYYLQLLSLLALAVLIRVIFFNGAFGSDDGTYYKSAMKIADGQWDVAKYNGALRYGFNIPAGAFMYVFGKSFTAANLWPLCCSLIEIAGVFWFTNTAVNRRAAWIAALLLACAPLQVAVATRIHADPIVSAALTMGFVFIYQGMRRDSPILLALAGVSIGMVFWSKELAAVVYLAFLPLVWFYPSKWRNIGIVVAAVIVMFALNFLLMYILAGDPLYAIKVVLNAVQHNFIEGGDGGANNASYYLPLLFLDIRHVGLLGWAALLALGLWRKSHGATGPRSAKLFVVIWLVGVVLVLSCFPVSLSPLRLTLKQSNYISLFLAPMAILGGAMIAQWSTRIVAVVLVGVVAIGLLLAALQQADYRAFAANSKAVAELAAAHPHYIMVASPSNSAMGTLFGNQRNYRSRIFAWNDAISDPKSLSDDIKAGDELVGAYDPQTAHWGAGAGKFENAPACWALMDTIKPQDLGFGNAVAGALLAVLQHMPTKIADKLGQRLGILANPPAATLYHVPLQNPWCN